MLRFAIADWEKPWLAICHACGNNQTQCAMLVAKSNASWTAAAVRSMICTILIPISVLCDIVVVCLQVSHGMLSHILLHQCAHEQYYLPEAKMQLMAVPLCHLLETYAAASCIACSRLHQVHVKLVIQTTTGGNWCRYSAQHHWQYNT